MNTSTPSPALSAKRRKGLSLIAVAVGVTALAWGGWHWLHGRHHQSTDNAYVAGNVVQITPQVGGTVTAIGADDNDFVKAGQVLVKLDAADAAGALAQAEAQLAQTVREVRGLFANTATLQAQLQAREADAVRAQTELARIEGDVRRRTPLVATGAVGREEFEHTQQQAAVVRQALGAAQAAVQAAREQLAASQAQIEGTRVAEHPAVQRAAAKVRETDLALQRIALVAPIDGHIAKRGVQLGQRVQAGSPLMTLVALDRLWVDANFKESQLQDLRIGQTVEMQADVYGSKVTYHGKIEGLGAGTGAAFALLPAQNATGNWIKVVQRVPVRVALKSEEVKAHPLRVGLSMQVEVDVSQQDVPMLAQAPRAGAERSTTVFDNLQADADARVARIIAANMGSRNGSPQQAAATGV